MTNYEEQILIKKIRILIKAFQQNPSGNQDSFLRILELIEQLTSPINNTS